MPKGTVTCNNILGLYYNAAAIANIADNAAASPIANIKVRLAPRPPPRKQQQPRTRHGGRTQSP